MIRRVLFCGAWDEGAGYPRAAALRQGLQTAGVTVDDCRAGAGTGRQKQGLLRAPWRWPGFLWRTLRQRRHLRRQLRTLCAERHPEVIVVPYPGHHLVADIARAAPVPVVLDLFLSAYDTAVLDRGLFAAGSLPARLLRALDRRACAAADLVLVDTAENAAFVADLLQLPAERFVPVPVGDPAAPATPTPYAAPARDALPVLFFGTGVPLHGLSVLLQAAAATPAVRLTLIGGRDDDRALAARLLGDRLRLLPAFVDRDDLQRELDRAALVAGVFGSGDKARRVVPFKVVHALAAGRPVITAATDAARTLLGGSGAAFLVPAGDPAALAAELRALAAAPERLAAAAAAARPCYDAVFATARTGTALARHLEQLVRTREER